MDESARQGGVALESVAKALAEWSVLRQEELDPTLEQRYGQTWRRDWVGDTHVRLRQLAQAIAVRRPEVFAAAVGWSAATFAARQLSPDDLKRNLASIAQIIEDRLPESVSSAAAPCLEAARKRLEAGVEPADADGGGSLEPLALRYLEAVLSGRPREAESIVLEAASNGRGIRELYTRVLGPAQVQIGRLWHAAEISVAEEHMATATTDSIMSRLRERFEPAAPNAKRLVAASVAGELHVLGVRTVADFFELDGWDVLYLGANLPNEDLIGCVVDHGADLLAVSVVNVLNLRTCGELIEAVRRTDGLESLKVIVGGAPFELVPDLWQELGADGSAGSAEAAVELGNRLVPAPAARRQAR